MFSSIQRLCSSAVRLLPTFMPKTIQACPFHICAQPKSFLNGATPILKPLELSVVPSCGFKVKGKLRRRCKDCYFVRREERLFVICKTHPRHKQMSMVKSPKNTWILSHATQGKIRPW